MKLRWVIPIAAAAALVAVPAFAGTTPGPTPAPTGGKILYSSTLDGQADIYSMDALGTSFFNITDDKTIGVRKDVQPAWSPTGNFVAFERQFTKGGANLMVVRSDGTKLRALTLSTSSSVWNCHPSWSNGNAIFFTSNRDGNFDLYVFPAIGKAPIQLTHTTAPVQNLGPAVSPDGKYVAFYRTGMSPTAAAPGLYLLRVNTGTVVRLTAPTRGVGDVEPVWSPDGKRLAFTSDRMGSADIWTVNIDGTHLVQVTRNMSKDVHPSFSPDGKRLVFVSERTGATELFVTAASTVPGAYPVRQLTFDRAFKANPSWQMPAPVPS